jgi:serine/threonine protein kinase
VDGFLFELDNGRYRVERLLGEGNFGAVYVGMDTHQDAQMAIKLFREGVDFDDVLMEAQIHTRLSRHTRVVTMRNVILEPPRPFVVMDYCPAGSVEAHLQRSGASLVEAIRWTRDALSGLSHAHALGVIHRDVKPGNWLLLDNHRVAISDFGIAEDTIRELRACNQIYLAHMAPELLNGESSAASDLWAVGCSLYRLLTASHPFETDAILAADFDFKPPHQINRQIPMSLTRVVQKALAVAPGDRYPDAMSMIGALNNCRIRASWSPLDDPEALESWEASTPSGNYRIRLVRRPRAGLELTAAKDLRGGAGFRRVRRESFQTPGRARQMTRRWLVEVVEGRSL